MLDCRLSYFVEVVCRGWRPLLYFTGIHIMLQYLYQLPISFSEKLKETADYVGFFKIVLPEMGLPEIIQSVALVAFFILVCFLQVAVQLHISFWAWFAHSSFWNPVDFYCLRTKITWRYTILNLPVRQLCVAVNDLDEDRRQQVAESGYSLPTSYSRNARSFNHGGGDNDLLTESLLPTAHGPGQRESLYV